MPIKTEVLGAVRQAHGEQQNNFACILSQLFPHPLTMQSILSFVLSTTFLTLLQFVSIAFQNVDAKIDHSAINGMHLLWFFSSYELNLE